MIKKLQYRFILVAMLSMLMVLTIIMGAINIMNYRNVTESADQVLTILKDNGGSFPAFFGKENAQDPTPFLEAAGMANELQSQETEGTASESLLSAGDGKTVSQSSESESYPVGNWDKEDKSPSFYGEGTMDRPGDEMSGQMSGPRGFGGRGEKISPETPYDSRYFRVTFAEDGSVADTDVSRIAAVNESQAEEMASAVYKSGRTSGFSGDYRFLAYEDGNGEKVIIFLDCAKSLGNFESFLFASVLVSVIGAAAVFLLVVLLSKIIIRPVQESYDKQRRFITDAGHELRTPLTIIDADVSVQEMDTGSSEWLDDIKAQTKRLSGLTNDLVYLSRMEEGSGQMQMIDFPISDVVSEIAGSYRARAQVEEKELICEITPMLSCCGDEKSISRVANILLDNALKYSSDHGKIWLSLARRGKGVELAVSNTVDSISEETLSHMFDRFYRADSSRNSEKGGYGIGLSIVSAVVQAHKGKVSATAVDEHTIKIAVVIG